MLLDSSLFAPAEARDRQPGIQLTNTGGSSLGINGVLGQHDFPGDYTAVPRPVKPMTNPAVSSAR